MKYLTNKKLWAAIIGLVTALGTFMVTLDEAKATLPAPTGFVAKWTYYGNTCTVPSTTNRIYAKYEIGTVNGSGLYHERYGFYNGGASTSKEVFIIKTYKNTGPTDHTYLYIDSVGTIRSSKTPVPFWSGQLGPNIIYFYEGIAALIGSNWKPTDWYTAQVHFVMDNTINGIVDANKCVWTSTIQPYM